VSKLIEQTSEKESLATSQEQDFIIGSNGHAGLSQRKAAELLKVSHVSISKVMKGDNLFASEEAESIAVEGFQGGNLRKLTKYFACSRRVSAATRNHCIDILDKAAEIGIQVFIDKMAGIEQTSTALSTKMEARIAEIVEERISIATESLTTKVVHQVSSALAEQLSLEELRSQVGEIYEDMSERKNRRRSWYLPADTPKDKIPDDYIKVSDGWLSPAAFEHQRRRSRWEMLRLEL